MAEPVYEPFDEDRVRLILLEEIYYLTRTADRRLRDTLKDDERVTLVSANSSAILRLSFQPQGFSNSATAASIKQD